MWSCDAYVHRKITFVGVREVAAYLSVTAPSAQDNFVSHTMRAEEEARIERINEKKSKSDVTHPLEPLIMSIVKGFVDDDDLSAKLQALYKVKKRSTGGNRYERGPVSEFGHCTREN